MRRELKKYRNMCRKNKVNYFDAREFFRLCNNGLWEKNKDVNNRLAWSMKHDQQAINDSIKQNK